MNVLVVNSGSSSLKFQVISTDLELIKQHADIRLCWGEAEGIGESTSIRFQARGGSSQTLQSSLSDIAAALKFIVRHIVSDASGLPEIKSYADVNAVGHRVVHGGERFKQSALIDDEVLKGIEDCVELAPLHNPDNIREFWRLATCLAGMFLKWPSSIPRFTSQFRSRLTYTRSLNAYIASIGSGAMGFTAHRIAMSRFAIAPCVEFLVSRPTSSRCILEMAARQPPSRQVFPLIPQWE